MSCCGSHACIHNVEVRQYWKKCRTEQRKIIVKKKSVFVDRMAFSHMSRGEIVWDLKFSCRSVCGTPKICFQINFLQQTVKYWLYLGCGSLRDYYEPQLCLGFFVFLMLCRLNVIVVGGSKGLLQNFTQGRNCHVPISLYGEQTK